MLFDMIRKASGIERRLTKPNHAWTIGDVELRRRAITEAIIKCFHHESYERLPPQQADLMAAENFPRRLTTLNSLIPYKYLAKIWPSEPDRLIVKPAHEMPGRNM